MKFLLDFSDNEMTEEEKEKLISAIREGKKVYPIEGRFFAEYDEAGFLLNFNDGFVGNLSCDFTEFTSEMGENGFEPKTFSKEEFEKLSKEEVKKLQEDAKESCKENPFKDKINKIVKPLNKCISGIKKSFNILFKGLISIDKDIYKLDKKCKRIQLKEDRKFKKKHCKNCGGRLGRGGRRGRKYCSECGLLKTMLLLKDKYKI
jgi:hypothetical protein